MAKAVCPFLGLCGGCKYDFTADDYHDKKMALIKNWKIDAAPFWTPAGTRRRADFAFADGVVGFFAGQTKNIVQIKSCPNLVPEINAILPRLAKLPLLGTGSVLVTRCDNGIDIAVNSNVPYFDGEFRLAASKLGAIRVSWNGTVVFQSVVPLISFGNKTVEYPIGAFLQPTVESENAMRDFVVENARGAKRVADLFCGIGNFTFALNADGFDIFGTGVRRDLFKKPLAPKTLNQYDCVIMDPPRAGAMAQCKELIKSNVPKIIYVSCNPQSLARDSEILSRGGYRCTYTIAFDQFVGAAHWELAVVFQK